LARFELFLKQAGTAGIDVFGQIASTAFSISAPKLKMSQSNQIKSNQKYNSRINTRL
jgi:hypothetical protein